METLTTLLQQLKGIDDTFYFDQSGNYFYIRKKGIPFNLGSSNKEEMKHFLIAFKKTGLKATANNIEYAHRVFGMITSLIAYGRASVKQIMEDEYLHGDLYNGISEIAKRTLATYLVNQVDHVGYAGDDSEGNSYNYLKLKEIA